MSLGPCWPSPTARRSVKHVVQVCQCLTLPLLSVGNVWPWWGDSIRAPTASKPRTSQFKVSAERKCVFRFTSPSSTWYFPAKPNFLEFQFQFRSVCHQSINCLPGHSWNPAGYSSPEPLSLSFVHCCYIFQDLSDSECFTKAWQRCLIHFPRDSSVSNCRMCCFASAEPEGWIWTFSSGSENKPFWKLRKKELSNEFHIMFNFK